MIDFISDIIAYTIVGFLSMLDHVVGMDSADVSHETIDQIDQMNQPDMLARWRYKINHALGGNHPFEDYAKDKNQEIKSCCCGCGCILIVLAVLTAIFVLFLLTL